MCGQFIGLALVVGTTPSCVKRTDYEELARRMDEQKRETQLAKEATEKATKRVEEIGEQLQQSQAETQKVLQDLEAQKKKLEVLKVEYESFKTQRRAAMVGKKYPELTLANGKKLLDAVIKEFSLSMVTFTHSGGIAKVSMRDLGEDIRWDACWNPQEGSEAEDEMEAEIARIDELRRAGMKEEAAKSRVARLEGLRRRATESQNLLAQLNVRVEKLRHEMNNVYANMFRSTSSSSGSSIRTPASDWNYAAPEASPMMTDFRKRPVVMGFSELETKRDEIIATLRKISATRQDQRAIRQALAEIIR